VWGSSVVVPEWQRTVARTPRRMDFDAACSRRNFGGAGGSTRLIFQPQSFPGRQGHPRFLAREDGGKRLGPALGSCAPDLLSDARYCVIAALRYAADGLCCPCAERRAARGS
jgi:hypothetical protein